MFRGIGWKCLQCPCRFSVFQLLSLVEGLCNLASFHCPPKIFTSFFHDLQANPKAEQTLTCLTVREHRPSVSHRYLPEVPSAHQTLRTSMRICHRRLFGVSLLVWSFQPSCRAVRRTDRIGCRSDEGALDPVTAQSIIFTHLAPSFVLRLFLSYAATNNSDSTSTMFISTRRRGRL